MCFAYYMYFRQLTDVFVDCFQMLDIFFLPLGGLEVNVSSYNCLVYVYTKYHNREDCNIF